MSKVYKPGIYRKGSYYIYIDSQNNEGKYIWKLMLSLDSVEDYYGDSSEQETLHQFMINAKRAHSDELRIKFND